MQNTLKQLSQESEQRWQRLLSHSPMPTHSEQHDPPEGYLFPYQTQQPLPYHYCDGSGREMLTGGVLQRGAVVWLRTPLQRGQTTVRVTGFSPSAGVIGVSAQGLITRSPK